MPIDFSYLEGVAPQEESTPVMPDTANVTIRVDADSMLLCDGEYIDQPFKAGALTKIQIPIGQHLLEFLYTEDPDIKIEKEVDFPEAGKSYLVLIKGLKELVDAAAEEVKRKAEEEARVKAEAEAKRIAEEEAKRKAEEEARRKAEEARVKAEAEAKKAEIKKIFDLAEDYYYGRNGKSKDYEKAVANYLIAAEAGDAYSLYSLGWCYEYGQGVEQSAREAVKWYRKAAEQGEKNAKERLGNAKELGEDYYYGRNGKSKDYKKAVANYLIAAEAGEAYSQYCLGWCYEHGLGVKKSVEETEKWYRKAAEQGEKNAKERLEILKAEAEAKRKAEEAKKLKGKSGTINGHDYVDLGLPSGLKWATCNVGADSPEKDGDYYAWGEVETKMEYTWKNCKLPRKKIKNISGNSTYDVACAKWGSSWRMPTEDEIRELWAKCKWLWTTKEGKNGFEVVGPNGNILFLPAADYWASKKQSSHTTGYYWSSEPAAASECSPLEGRAWILEFRNGFQYIERSSRCYGYSVRPVSK